MSKAVIKVKNLNKTFYIHEDKKNTLRELFASLFNQGRIKKFKALDNVNLSINKGEFVGIVGRNGSGKSTLLKLIAQIYSPDKGSQIEVKGKLVPFLELGVGFNTELTGKENIYLNGVILGMTKEYLDKKFNEIVEFAELEEFINEPVKNYSSGMMVRLAFSIAIQAKADIYILDEVLAVGDVAFQRKCLTIFNKLKKEGKTVLFVSHSMESVEQFCDRAILLHNHKVEIDGKVSDVAAAYRKIMSPESAKKSKTKNNKRWGNGEGEIKSVKLNKKDKVYTEEDKLQLQIDFETFTSFEKFAVGIALYKSDGTLVTGTNNFKYEKPRLVEKGKHSSTVELETKYLLSGEYEITVAIFDMSTTTPLDYHHQTYGFTVDTNSKDIGLVSLPFKFK